MTTNLQQQRKLAQQLRDSQALCIDFRDLPPMEHYLELAARIIAIQERNKQEQSDCVDVKLF